MERKIRLGELLLRANLITELQLKTALAEQQKWGGKLGKILVDMNYVSEDILIKALSKQLNIARANLDAIQVPPQILEKLDRTFCEQNLVVPCAYSHNDRAVQVAMFDPTNLRALDELKFRTGLRVVPALAGQKAIAQAIGRLFHSESLRDDGDEGEFKVTGNSGSTIVRKVAEIEAQAARAAAAAAGQSAPPPPPQPPPQAPVPAWQPQASYGLSVPPNPAAAPTGNAALEELDKLQKRQTKAIKTVLELLIEKGVFSREEYMAWLNRPRQ